MIRTAQPRSAQHIPDAIGAVSVLRTTLRVLDARSGALGTAAWIAFGPFVVLDVLSVLRSEPVPFLLSLAYGFVRCGFAGVAVLLARDALNGAERPLRSVAKAAAGSWGLLIALEVATGGLVLLGLAAFVVPGLVLLAAFSLAPVVCLAERRGVLASLARSVALVRGQLAAVAAVVAVAVLLLALAAAPLLAAYVGDASVFARVGLVLLSAIAAPVAYAFSATAAAVLYERGATGPTPF